MLIINAIRGAKFLLIKIRYLYLLLADVPIPESAVDNYWH